MYKNQRNREYYWHEPEYLIIWKLLNERKILQLSHGEVKISDTLNYRNMRPVQNGLFGENIFGPIKPYECRCGMYKGTRYKGIVCHRCGVSVEDARVRREWFGHINLNCKVVWPMFLKGNPSILSIVLDIPQALLMNIIYNDYKVDVDLYWKAEDNKNSAILSDKEIGLPHRNYLKGVDAISQILSEMNLEKEIDRMRFHISNNDGYLSVSDRHRLEVLKSFISHEISPGDMVTSKLLVLPADMRPIVEYEGKIYSTDINQHYIKIINRANRLARFNKLKTPELILLFQKRLIQQAVNNLFDKCFYNDNKEDNNESLIDFTRRKQRRFLDYSGACSVLPNGSVPLDAIALPESMLMELYKPFLIEKFMGQQNSEWARKRVEEKGVEVSDTLKSILRNESILVENEKSLEFVGLKVIITSGSIAYLHPYTFDYLDLRVNEVEKIKVFVPLSSASRSETQNTLGLNNNILSPFTGRLKLRPDRITLSNIIAASKMNEEGNTYNCISKGEVFLKADQREINKNSRLFIRNNTPNGFVYEEETSLGRILINECLPQDLGRVNRKSLRNKYLLEFNCEFTEVQFLQLLEEIYDKKGPKYYLKMLSRLYVRFGTAYPEEGLGEAPKSKKHINMQLYEEQVNKYRPFFATLAMGELKKERTTTIILDHDDLGLHPFISGMIRYKRVAEDIYSGGEIRYRKGTLLTDDILNDVAKYTKSLEIYKFAIVRNTISKKGYGDRDIRTGLQSLQVLGKTLSILSEIGEDRNFVSILYGCEPILLSNRFLEVYRKFSVPNQVKGPFSNLIKEEKYLYLDELKRYQKDEQYLVKAYACFILLQCAQIEIDFRHVELWVCLFQNIRNKKRQTTPLVLGEELSIETLADFAIGGGYQSSLDYGLTSLYGKLCFENTVSHVI